MTTTLAPPAEQICFEYFEQTPNTELVTVSQLVEAIAPLAMNNYSQAHFGLQRDNLSAESLFELLHPLKPLKIEYKRAVFYDFPDFRLLTLPKSLWLSRIITKTPSGEVETWELREVSRKTLAVTVATSGSTTTVDGLYVRRTSNKQAIQLALKPELKQEPQHDFREYGVKIVCAHTYKRMWFIDTDQLQLYFDVMQYGKNEYYVVGSVKVHNSTNIDLASYPMLQNLKMIYPVPSKITHQLSVKKEELYKKIAYQYGKADKEKQQQLCYNQDPLMTPEEKEELRLKLSKVESWMKNTKQEGNPADFVNKYDMAFFYL